MGDVFLADDTSLGRKVALKFLAKDFRSDPDHLARFKREARAASALNHPNICTIYEINDSFETPFISMEFVEGETLAQMIRRRRRSVRQTLNISIQVADALANAHAAGVVHRDIKPANILVGPDGRVKILDFGLAKRFVPSAGDDSADLFVTRAGTVVGTAAYMSPEQARGLDVVAATDIWSLGVCMYEMLTGRQPFSGATSTDMLVSILTQDPVPPSQIFPEIPVELERTVLKSLQRSTDIRYATVNELLEDLRELQKKAERSAEPAEPGVANANERTQLFEHATTEISLNKPTHRPTGRSDLRTGNFPRFLHPIIGRSAEIENVAQLLRNESVRLVTLTGIGGTGKTRLAEAVAHAMIEEFPDGVYFIEIAEIDRPELVTAAIAKPFGFADKAGRPVAELLHEHLFEKRVLLVIDNFEQAVDAADQIARLIAATETPKIVVTSRTVLRLSSEVEFVVPPLAPPANATEATLAELSQNPAVKLFAERASTVNPSFRLTDENIHEIAAITAKVDGLPLAIELAAARVRVLSCLSILERLEDRLRILTDGPRDLPERHRTMRAMVEWSTDLLSDEEKRVFRRLAVFSGGFTLEAAEVAVPVGEKLDENADGKTTDILDLVTSLADKSLLFQRDRKDGDRRFRMFEVVRDYAFELLAASGEEEPMRRRHAEHFLAFAETAEPFIQAAQSADWLVRLERDHDNLRAAMNWAFQNDPHLAVRGAVALRNYCILHGHLTEGYRWLKSASEIGQEPPSELRFKLMNGLGLAARFCGDVETARRAYEAGLRAGMEASDKKAIALSNRGLGLVTMQTGDYRASRRYLESGLEISRGLGDDFGTALSLAFLGDVCRNECRFSDAVGLFKDAIELFRKLENRSALGDALNNLGAAAFCEGDLQTARQSFEESLAIARELENKITISYSLDGFAALAIEDGDLEHSANISIAAEDIRNSIGYQIESAERAFRERYLNRLRALGGGKYLDHANRNSGTITIDEAVALVAVAYTRVEEDGEAFE
jgi:non-specific serine/threonine protein kinase